MGRELTALSVRLRPAASLAAYVDNPIGRYIAAPNAAAFCTSETLNGLSFWGRPAGVDVDTVTIALRAAAQRPALLVDVRKVDLLDLDVFDKLSAELTAHFATLGAATIRLAVVVPLRPTGALFQELFGSLGHKASAASFPCPADALGWLGIHDPTLPDDLERLFRRPPPSSVLLERLHGVLDRQPTSQARDTARVLGISQRSFQRRLRDSGTTFRREVNDAHLRIAKALLSATEQPLKWIAIEAGYGSLQHFSSSFHAHVGMSPTRWRILAAERPPAVGLARRR